MEYNFLTSEAEKSFSTDFITIVSVLTRMQKSGALVLGTGYCGSTGDMVKTALGHRGIKSRIVECQLTLTYLEFNPPEVIFVGFTDIVIPGQIDTHVVVVTETDPPYLIDASIQNRLTANNIAVVERVKFDFADPLQLVDVKFNDANLSMSYYQKKNQVFALSHNDSIVQRIETDKKIFKSLFIVKVLLSLAMLIGVLNASRGAYDFYQIYINENHWGPNAGQKIDERLQRLESLLNK